MALASFSRNPTNAGVPPHEKPPTLSLAKVAHSLHFTWAVDPFGGGNRMGRHRADQRRQAGASGSGEEIPAPKDIQAPKTAADLRTIEAQVKQVLKKAIPCTVNIAVGGAEGSGVIVSRDGLVLTAGHVVMKPGLKVLFRFADGKTAKGVSLGMFQGWMPA